MAQNKNFKTLNLIMSALFAVLVVSCSGAGKEDRLAKHGPKLTEYSELLAIYDHDGYEEVIIANAKGEDVARYILIEHDDSLPADIPEDAVVLRVPLTSLVIDSEVYGGAIDELGKIESIKGVFDPGYVTIPILKSRIAEGKVRGTGKSSSPDLEKIMAIEPDGILISYYEGMETGSLEKAGVPIVKMYDLQETSPLGRAEWIKLLGRLVGREEEADSIFVDVASKYTEIKENLKKSGDSPKILVETPYNGVWYVAGGNSYQATMIQDAGGAYPWSDDNSSGALNLSLEQVLDSANDADIWLIKVFGKVIDRESLLREDKRYGNFKALKNGDVYYSDTSESGYFVEFPFHPERLLDDYRLIFSGDTTRQLRYFKKI